MGPGQYPQNQGPYPPQGYPAGAGQQPYPPAQQPYPPHQGYPPNPGGFPGGPGYGGGPGFPPPMPRRRGFSGGRLVGSIVGLVVVIAVVVIALVTNKGNPDTAAVGDCVSRNGTDDVKVVKCTDPGADYKVVGKVENKTRAEFTIETDQICKPFRGAQSAFWKGKVGGTGYVLCLGPV